MRQKGRQSAAALAVVGGTGAPMDVRPRPPAELTDEQGAVWRSIANRLPADWFPAETHGLLAQYCRHAVRARRFAHLLTIAETAAEFDLKEYRELCRAEEEQSRAMASLATRMRFTQQATVHPEKARRPGVGPSAYDTMGMNDEG